MTDKARLLKIKAQLKKRQPKFIRQDAHKHKRVKQVWRRPQGLHSKMKDSKRGYRMKLKEGFRTPNAVRGLDRHGLKPTLIALARDLEKLDVKTHSVIVSGTIGDRKRLALVEAAIAKGFKLQNASQKTADAIKTSRKEQSEEKKQRASKKESRMKELEAKTKQHDKKSKDAKEAKEDAAEDAEDAKKEEQKDPSVKRKSHKTE